MAKDPVHPLARKSKSSSTKTSKPRPARKTRAAAGKSASADKPKKTAKRRRPARKHTGPPVGKVRIQKALAEAGVASRRACEEMITEARVRVNRKLVTELPCFIDPDVDKVTVDGKGVKLAAERKVYVLLNKPRGVVCTNSDPAGRRLAVEMLTDIEERVFCVGRLDIDSTGVILLTNDGDFANRISHPRYGLAKTYVVEVDGYVSGESMEKLKGGMYLDGKRTSGAAVKVLKRSKVRTLLEIRLREGRNREIRRMLARLHYKVRSLRRKAIGSVTDRGIKTGHYRRLAPKEVKALLAETQA